MNTKDLTPGDKITAIFKGGPKSGKTVAEGSFPEPYFLDVDGRIRSLKKAFPDKSIEYDQFYEFWPIIKKLESLVNRCDFGTVVVSSLTSVANLAIEYSLKNRGVSIDENSEEAQPSNKRGKKTNYLKRGNIPLTDVSDWGVEFRGLSAMLELLKALPCHVILEAHVLTTEKENIIAGTKTSSQRLMTGGKTIAAYLPTAFDEIYHFYTETDINGGTPSFKAATTHQGEDWAGTVLPLPPVIEWTNKNFFEIIQKYCKEPYDPNKPFS